MIERLIIKTRRNNKINEHYYYEKGNQLRCTYLNDGFDYECDGEKLADELPRVFKNIFGDNSEFQVLSIIFDPEEIDKILTMKELTL